MDERPSDPNPCRDLTVPVTDADHYAGAPAAPVVLVEYGDYECPYCLNAQPIIREVRRHLADELGFVFRHFPQNSIHPHASQAAMAAEAAGAQGKFWEMHDLLFRHQQKLAELDMTYLALQLGLEVYRFETDARSTAHSRRLREDFAGGLASGVKGTPSFFINGCRYAGPVDVPSLEAALRAAAAGPGGEG